MKTSTTVRIGEAAQLVGVSVATLRLWESQGLIHPARTAGGIRRYTAEDLDVLHRIVSLRKEHGLNPRAISRLLAREHEFGVMRQDAQPEDSTIARELRKRRKQIGLTLREVAERTGLSISHVSAVERNQQRPSFAALLSITQCYGIMIQDLITNRERSGRLVRVNDRPRVPSVDHDIQIEQLALGATSIEPQLFRVPPGGGSGGFYRHHGEEFVFVLTGQVTFWLGEREQHDMEKGDSLYFPSSIDHRWSNDGDSVSELLWVSISTERT